MKKYRFYEDPGHGWLKVPKFHLAILGIEDQISGYSYMKGLNAYLEEDCDAPLFVKAMGTAWNDDDVLYNHCNKQSAVRSYDHYIPMGSEDAKTIAEGDFDHLFTPEIA